MPPITSVNIASIYSYLAMLLASPVAGWFLGVVNPWLVATLQKPGKPKWLQALTMAAVCFVTALVVVLHQENLGVITKDRVPMIFIQTIVATIVMYVGFWKYLGIGKWEEFSAQLPGKAAEALGSAVGIIGAFRQFLAVRDAFNAQAIPIIPDPNVQAAPKGRGTVFTDGAGIGNATTIGSVNSVNSVNTTNPICSEGGSN